MPESLLPAAVESPSKEKTMDISWLAITENWNAVVLDLSDRGVDLYDEATRARSWLGVRTHIFALLDSPSRLRAALLRR